jgi:hypothetical protein
VDRDTQGMKRSSMTDGYGIPQDRVLAAASRYDSPATGPSLGNLSELDPLPDDIRVYLDAGYDSQVARDDLVDVANAPPVGAGIKRTISAHGTDSYS